MVGSCQTLVILRRRLSSSQHRGVVLYIPAGLSFSTSLQPRKAAFSSPRTAAAVRIPVAPPPASRMLGVADVVRVA